MYIAFEGGEGSGKSTQARLLAKRLDAVVTREPGGTELGASIRSLVLDPGQAPVGARAETLLMAADRAQHAQQVIKPAIDAGRHVISDRSVYSSLAYQGGGRGLGVDAIRSINEWALDGCWPELVVLLDIDREAARARLSRSLDRLEQETEAFHDRIRGTYLDLAADDERWLVFDGSGEIGAVAEAIAVTLSPLVGNLDG